MTDDQRITRSLTREQWRALLIARYYRKYEGVYVWTEVCGWCMWQITEQTPHTGDCPLAEENDDA